MNGDESRILVAVPEDEMGVVPAASLTIFATESMQTPSSLDRLKPVGGGGQVRSVMRVEGGHQYRL